MGRTRSCDAGAAATAPRCRSLDDRRASIRAVAIDMSGEYQRAIRDAVPDGHLL
jgi:hypothetical protein